MKKVLVVDNSATVLRFMKNLLTGKGYEVTTAIDGLSALKILDSFSPDIIFIDLVMPNITGDKLCRIIRGMPRFRETFLVILSAAAVEQGLDFNAIGADACIAKGPSKVMAGHITLLLDTPKTKTNLLPEEIIGKEGLGERAITRELLEIKKHYEMILGNMSDGFLEVTPDGRIIFANTMAAHLIGLPEESLLSMKISDLFNDQNGQAREMLTACREGMENSAGIPVRRNDKDLLISGLPVLKKSKKLSRVVIIRDVTEQKKAENALLQAQEELETKVRERTSELSATNIKLQDELKKGEQLLQEKLDLIVKLQKAVDSVKLLSGFIPICSSCKKIRNDQGYWDQLESYISKHSDARFSHSICPDCAERLYPDLITDAIKPSNDKPEK